MILFLKHIYNHPKGKLKFEVPEPDWLASPSHRIKVVAKPIFALAAAPKGKSSGAKVGNPSEKILRIYAEDQSNENYCRNEN